MDFTGFLNAKLTMLASDLQLISSRRELKKTQICSAQLFILLLLKVCDTPEIQQVEPESQGPLTSQPFFFFLTKWTLWEIKRSFLANRGNRIRPLARSSFSPLVNRIFTGRKGGTGIAVVEPKIDGDFTHRNADSPVQKLCGNFQNVSPGTVSFPPS